MSNESDGLASRLQGDFARFVEVIEPKLDRIEQKLRETPVTVVVFGPGRKGGDVYKKRQQIREELHKLPGVIAYFPEEREFAKPFKKRFGISGKRPAVLEILQAEAADMIIALEPGSGVESEVSLFATVRPTLVVKMLNLLPEAYKKTRTAFAASLREAVPKHYYTQREMETCQLAREVCVGHVRDEQVMKAYLRAP